MPPIKRMLVPTDFSAASEIAFKYAISLAAREGASLHVLHVVDDVHFQVGYPDGFYAELPDLRARLIDEATAELTRMAARCAAVGVPVTVEVVVGRPVPLIANSATQRGTELIVMGTHGRSGFAHLMLGSVAERVLRTAPCPVLTVRDTALVADAIAAEALRERQSIAAAC